ncbi:hypothetical protein B0H12DRAFT_1229089 [Mycena haematopus]|nr:hypothetical protein B0H12DRAFT_1229089 [Mycena haematopus]
MASQDVHGPALSRQTSADICLSEDPSHGHVLSDKSTKLQRDTFFFESWGSWNPIRLVLGLNQKLTPVTSATLRRWVRLIVGYPEDFSLRPVIIKPLGIMSYSMSPSGPVVSPDSEDPLPPGNYGWYPSPPSSEIALTGPGLDTTMINRSFEYSVGMMGDQLQALYTFPADVKQIVLARDAQRCRITRDAADVMVVWIVPPPWAWKVATEDDPPAIAPRRCENSAHPVGMDTTPFIVAANAVTMRSDLKVHFYNHNFTVDADDNYRVVILRQMGEAQNLLPTYLPRHPEYDADDATFFRLHLRASMKFMLLGGDISEKYSPSHILHEMEELGVPGPVGGQPDCEMAPLSDPRWQTELGQAILADVLSGRMTETSLDSSEGSDPEDTNAQSEYISLVDGDGYLLAWEDSKDYAPPRGLWWADENGVVVELDDA